MLVTPAAAPAANVKYYGPAANGPETTVEIRVRIKKGKPKMIWPFEVLRPYVYCSDGTERYIGSSQLDDSHDFPSNIFVRKKGRFHDKDVDDQYDPEDSFPPSGNIYEVRGTVRKSSASGTFRMTFNFQQSSPGLTCDTGVVSWTAAPRAQ